MAARIKYVIEKGVRVPGYRPGGLADTIRKLQMGESFLVPCKKDEALKVLQKVGTTFGRAARGEGKEFTARRVRGGVRVWRVL